jgi:hypothetical protein
MARIRAAYGASPLHLLAHLVALPFAAWALLQVAATSTALTVFAWLIASVLLHDLLLLPFYGVLDRAARAGTGRAVNHVRVPALISGLLLLVFLPVISGKGAGAFHGVSGLDYQGYLGRWLAITAALFAVSGLLYLLRRMSGGSRS